MDEFFGHTAYRFRSTDSGCQGFEVDWNAASSQNTTFFRLI